MNKYSEYSYSRTLKLLDDWYEADTDKTNYAQALLGMNDCENIEGCFKIYKIVHKKYLRLVKSDEHFADGDFYEDLNTCLNENLLRLFQQNTSIENKNALRYLVNMRHCKSIEKHQRQWETIVSQKGLDILESNVASILDAHVNYVKARDEYMLKEYPIGSNGYERVTREISDNLKLLKSYGYKVLPYDTNFSYMSKFNLYVVLIGLFALFVAFVILLALSSSSIQLIVVLCLGIGLAILKKYIKGI